MTKKKEVILKTKPAEVAEEVAGRQPKKKSTRRRRRTTILKQPARKDRQKKKNNTHVIEPYGKCKARRSHRHNLHLAKGREALRIKRERINAEKARPLEEEKEHGGAYRQEGGVYTEEKN
jgi:hypothetical protein